MTSDGYGLNFRESFAYFDRVSSSWKTSQACLVEGWDTFSETWPEAGMIRSGKAYRLPRLVRRISERGFSLLPTPRASMKEGSKGGTRANGKPRSDIRDYAMVPTPTATMHKHGYSGQEAKALLGPEIAGGPINPDWIEHLMGFPIGWTDCKDLATL